MKGIYRIMQTPSKYWVVCKKVGMCENGAPHWRIVSNTYLYRGWAKRFAKLHYLPVDNA